MVRAKKTSSGGIARQKVFQECQLFQVSALKNEDGKEYKEYKPSPVSGLLELDWKMRRMADIQGGRKRGHESQNILSV